MKKQNNPNVQAHLLQGTCYLLLVLAFCVIPLALAQRNTTKTERKGQAFPANVIVVTNTNDSGPGSLRDALAVANDGDTIDATGISGTISLTSGELQITHAVTINGPGAESLLVAGNGTFRVFHNLASHVTISGLFIAGGSAPGDNGGGVLNEGGNSAILRLNQCTIAGNSADSGGGIFNLNGKLWVNKGTIDNNTALFSGGGIANSALNGAAKLIITNSTISDFANANGGCIVNGATGSTLSVGVVIVSNSTILGFAFGNGGAIRERL